MADSHNKAEDHSDDHGNTDYHVDTADHSDAADHSEGDNCENLDDELSAEELKKLFPPENFKKQLMKNIFLGVLGLLCLWMFMVRSEPWVAIAGVVTVVFIAYLSENFGYEQPLQCHGRTVLITGCDTGFGNLLAQHLAQRGVTVFAGCYDQSSEESQTLKNEKLKNLHVLQMDVTNQAQVDECVKYVNKITEGKGLYGLVNNAGLNFLGDIEITTMDQFEKVAAINQLGLVRVTKAFLPLVRTHKGRILNVSSVKGRLAMPFNSAYAMTKYAVEAFSDILRMECKKFGVTVSIIEPSNFGGATGCLNMSRIRGDFEEMWRDMSKEAKALYGRSYLDHHVATCVGAIPTASFDLMLVIKSMEHALFSSKPNSRYLIAGGSGWYDIYKYRVYLNPLLPAWLMDWWLLNDVKSFKLAQQ